MPTLIGRKVGKYQLVELLGQGGMAEVYKAFQPGVERFVAVKVMHGYLAGTPDFVTRFQREARAIGRLQHPHIVRVIDFDVESDVYYMVMDYLQGGALDRYLQDKYLQDKYLQDKKPLPVAESLALATQLADALAYAHKQGMIHRDIKPGNIMFEDAEHRQVVLTDFGIASLRNDATAGMTVTGAMVGTPTYMSPEAARGEKCDERADIYSLGVVLYEMVTGKTPYQADTPYRMMMKLSNEPLPPPRSLNPNLPPDLEAILLKALAKEAADRYQSADELLDALQEVQASLFDNARPRTTANRSATTSSRPPLIKPASSASRADAPRSNAPAPRPPSPRSGGMILGLAAVGVLLVAWVTYLLLTLLGGDELRQAAKEAVVVATNTPAATATVLPSGTVTSETVLSETVISETVVNGVVVSETIVNETVVSETTDSGTVVSETIVSQSMISDTIASEPASSEATSALPLFPLPVGALRFSDNEMAANGNFAVQLHPIKLAPLGSHYELWLQNSQSETINLGAIEVVNGRAHLRSSSKVNLVTGFDQALITIESDDSKPSAPSENHLLASQWPPEFSSKLRQILTGEAGDTSGLSPLALAQSQLAAQHGGFLQDALAKEDWPLAQRHAEHIVNILDGKEGEHYGDHDGDGQAQNPGDGVGVRLYLNHLQDQLTQAMTAINAPQEMDFNAKRAQAAIQNSQAMLTQAIEKALQLFAADTVQEAQPTADALNGLLGNLLNGVDQDGNGVIDPVRNEGGVLAISDYAQRLAVYYFYDQQMMGDTQLAIQSNLQSNENQVAGWLRFANRQAEPLPTPTPQAHTSDSGGHEAAYDEYGGGYGGGDSGDQGDSTNATNSASMNLSPSKPARLIARQFNLEINHAPAPPAEHQYNLWLLSQDSSQSLFLGVPQQEGDRLLLEGVVPENLLSDYTQAILTIEPLSDADGKPGERIIFRSTHSAPLHEMLQQLLVGTKEQPALLTASESQLLLAIDHTGFVLEALAENNHAKAMRHAEHVVNILDGKGGQHFGDLDGDGRTQNPGDGVGVRVYLQRNEEQVLLAANAITGSLVTEQAHFYALRSVASSEQTMQWIEQAMEKGLQLFATDTAAEAQPVADELQLLLDAALNGKDQDENGVIDPMSDEGALSALIDHVVMMGEFGLVEEATTSQ